MRRMVAATLAGVLLSACSAAASGEWRFGPIPTCDTTSRGRLLLVAQSVPDAEFIPCIEQLPAGWELTSASTRSSRSTLAFTTDTYDLDVDVVLTPACDVATAVPAESPFPDTDLYVGRDDRTWSYVFEGGCIAFFYETAEFAATAAGRDFMDGIDFMARQRLGALSGWTL